MTRIRTFGRDFGLLDWVRSQPELDSCEPSRIVVSDFDFVIHQYRSIKDRVGDRAVDNIMFVESKTHCIDGPAKLRISQKDTWMILNRLIGIKCDGYSKHRNVYYSRNIKMPNGEVRTVRWFGIHLLSLQGERPENSTRMWWNEKEITIQQLKLVLSFALNPKTLRRRDEKRHHSPLRMPLFGEGGTIY